MLTFYALLVHWGYGAPRRVAKEAFLASPHGSYRILGLYCLFLLFTLNYLHPKNSVPS